MRLFTCLAGLLFWTSVTYAQQLHMPDLFHCLKAPADQFDACMFRQGFICYKSTGGLTGWTCLFAYQPTPLNQDPAQAPALIQYDRNSRMDILSYQVRSKKQYEQLRKELIQLGYRVVPDVTDRELFTNIKLANMAVSCCPAKTATGLSGNYDGYIFTFTNRRY